MVKAFSSKSLVLKRAKSKFNLFFMSSIILLLCSCQNGGSKNKNTDGVFNDPNLKKISTEDKIHAMEVLIPVQETLLIIKALGDGSSFNSEYPVTNSLISKIKSECFIVKGASVGFSRTINPFGFNLSVFGSPEKKCPVSISHKSNVVKDSENSRTSGFDFFEKLGINSTFTLNQFGTPGSSFLKYMNLTSSSSEKQHITGDKDRIYETNTVFEVDVTSTYYDSYKVYYSYGQIQKSKNNTSDGIYDKISFENWTIHLPEYNAQLKSETRLISSNETQTRYFFNNKEINKTNLDNIIKEAARRVANY